MCGRPFFDAYRGTPSFHEVVAVTTAAMPNRTDSLRIIKLNYCWYWCAGDIWAKKRRRTALELASEFMVLH
jgi:hypothetical protein